MSITGPSGIQGQLLEVTVVGCNKLKDTEWISRQDPYVCLEYGSTKIRTRTCTGLREMNVAVWNSNTLTRDDFVGNGKIQLLKVLSQGFDDSAWTLQTKTGSQNGLGMAVQWLVSLALVGNIHFWCKHWVPYKAFGTRAFFDLMFISKPKMIKVTFEKQGKSSAPSAPPYIASSVTQVPPCSTTPPASAPYHPPVTSYGTSSSYPSYPPNPAAYPPSPYPPPPAAYPPLSYPPPSSYPPSAYPPYLPPPQAPSLSWDISPSPVLRPKHCVLKHRFSEAVLQNYVMVGSCKAMLVTRVCLIPMIPFHGSIVRVFEPLSPSFRTRTSFGSTHAADHLPWVSNLMVKYISCLLTLSPGLAPLGDVKKLINDIPLSSSSLS
ncbi:C2 domain [Dillenia turbinata]|uniref:C2 domain n=1 Tax=Dillenia turbinata TaxID=194707 RepID=A0AAN8ZLL9_9MAGN